MIDLRENIGGSEFRGNADEMRASGERGLVLSAEKFRYVKRTEEAFADGGDMSDSTGTSGVLDNAGERAAEEVTEV